MRPWLLRPPVRFAESSRLFSGVVFVTSSKEDTERKRRPGLVGLYLRKAISDHSPSEPSQPLDGCPLEDLDPVARAELHDGLLPAGLRALVVATALRLRLHLDDVHALDLDVEELL